MAFANQPSEMPAIDYNDKLDSDDQPGACELKTIEDHDMIRSLSYLIQKSILSYDISTFEILLNNDLAVIMINKYVPKHVFNGHFKERLNNDAKYILHKAQILCKMMQILKAKNIFTPNTRLLHCIQSLNLQQFLSF